MELVFVEIRFLWNPSTYFQNNPLPSLLLRHPDNISPASIPNKASQRFLFPKNFFILRNSKLVLRSFRSFPLSFSCPFFPHRRMASRNKTFKPINKSVDRVFVSFLLNLFLPWIVFFRCLGGVTVIIADFTFTNCPTIYRLQVRKNVPHPECRKCRFYYAENSIILICFSFVSGKNWFSLIEILMEWKYV